MGEVDGSFEGAIHLMGATWEQELNGFDGGVRRRCLQGGPFA